MSQSNTLTLIKLQNLEISENLLLWGMRHCLNSYKLDILPLKKLLLIYSKFKIDDISYSLNEIMKLIVDNNSTQSMGFKCNCTFLTEEEFNLLCAISNIQSRNDYNGKKLLEIYLPNSKLLFAFKECINIANSLERENYFLPLRHNDFIDHIQKNSKRVLH